jgi:galactokinase
MTNNALSQHFNTLFSAQENGHVSSPGRVNLIGEFTDYNDGFVLPVALNFRTHVLYRHREDNQFVVRSLNYPGESDVIDIDSDIVKGQSQWGNYIRAVCFVLKRAGHTLGGLDLLINSDVPQGAGLSSSAALQVAVAGAINKAFDLGIKKEQLALFGQQAENDFMDCQCGIMDQLVSAKGEKNSALLIDCENLETQSISIPERLKLVIINSNFKRKLVESEYNQRRTDCEQAASKMGVSSLRKASLELLMEHKDVLSENEFKRAHHVLTENDRVIKATYALKNDDMDALVSLMSASHISLRDDFEVTVPATDGLVEICNSVLNGRGAVRMTGGGFGGAIVCLCEQADIDIVKAAVEQQYSEKFGLEASFYVCESAVGFTD